MLITVFYTASTSATGTGSPLTSVRRFSGFSALILLFTFVGFFIRFVNEVVDALESADRRDTFDDIRLIFFLCESCSDNDESVVRFEYERFGDEVVISVVSQVGDYKGEDAAVKRARYTEVGQEGIGRNPRNRTCQTLSVIKKYSDRLFRVSDRSFK